MDHRLSTRASSATSSAIRDLLRLLEQPELLSLAGGRPAAEGFAVERIRDAADRALTMNGRYGPVGLQYGPTEGDGNLRTIVAARLCVDAESVLITTGSQQGLELLAKALIDPGDVVVVTSPTYLGALQAMRGLDPNFVVVPSDNEGIDTEALREMLADGLRPKSCYVVSAFANPSGVTMPQSRRAALMELADRYGFVVIDDDPYGELRFRGLAPQATRMFGENVVSLGTASKILAPGLRCGWLSAPGWLIKPIVRMKQASDLHTSSLSQLIVADVLADASFMDAHLESLRTLYRQRCDVLANAVEDFVAIDRPDGGLFLWGRISGIDTTAALNSAIANGVAYVPGSAFEVGDSTSDLLRMSFASLRPDQLLEAASRLRTAFEHARKDLKATMLTATTRKRTVVVTAPTRNLRLPVD